MGSVPISSQAQLITTSSNPTTSCSRTTPFLIYRRARKDSQWPKIIEALLSWAGVEGSRGYLWRSRLPARLMSMSSRVVSQIPPMPLWYFQTLIYEIITPISKLKFSIRYKARWISSQCKSSLRNRKICKRSLRLAQPFFPQKYHQTLSITTPFKNMSPKPIMYPWERLWLGALIRFLGIKGNKKIIKTR